MAGTRSSYLAVLLLVLALPCKSVQAADRPAIDQAIERGVSFLRSQQDAATGTWDFPGHKPGATALAALTLLECAVPSGDASVQSAARVVRQVAPTLTNTYCISLTILLLDRLGEPADVPLIQLLGVHLLAGQNGSGGWSYDCPGFGGEEIRWLQSEGRDRTGDVARPQAARLPPEVQRQLKLVNPERPGPQASDNSNTKFATLALWVARRHGLPVGKALQLVETRFRRTQNPDGGWGYFPHPGGRTPLAQSMASMTCAGLLGLAVGTAYESVLHSGDEERGGARSSRLSHHNPKQDAAIRAGLALLGRVLSGPLGDARSTPPIPLFEIRNGDEYYFLWALERVAVGYGLETIGRTDWYSWGTTYLLSRQGANGAWQAEHGFRRRERGPDRGGEGSDEGYAMVDTCFALLFLRQANLSKDLTITLRGQLEEPAPGQHGRARPLEPSPSADGRASNRVFPERPGGPAPGRATPGGASGTSSTPAELNPQALVNQLVQSSPARRDALLQEYRTKKGAAFTEALAGAISRLDSASKTKARDALAERLARMTPETLRSRLGDPEPEMRRAAALACAMRDAANLVPDLIALLGDTDSGVVRAAHAALKSLTGKDFGPSTNSSAEDRRAAAAAWKAWWDSQKNP